MHEDRSGIVRSASIRGTPVKDANRTQMAARVDEEWRGVMTIFCTSYAARQRENLIGDASLLTPVVASMTRLFVQVLLRCLYK